MNCCIYRATCFKLPEVLQQQISATNRVFSTSCHRLISVCTWQSEAKPQSELRGDPQAAAVGQWAAPLHRASGSEQKVSFLADVSPVSSIFPVQLWIASADLSLRTRGLVGHIKKMICWLVRQENEQRRSWHYRPDCCCPLYLVLNQCSHGTTWGACSLRSTQWCTEGNRNLAPPGVRIDACVPSVVCPGPCSYWCQGTRLKMSCANNCSLIGRLLITLSFRLYVITLKLNLKPPLQGLHALTHPACQSWTPTTALYCIALCCYLLLCIHLSILSVAYITYQSVSLCLIT